jgi:hypothetical protein
LVQLRPVTPDDLEFRMAEPWQLGDLPPQGTITPSRLDA